MSSPYTPLVHLPQLADENPTLLTIRRADFAEANGDETSRSLRGTDASRYIGSAQADISSWGSAQSDKKFGFGNSKFGANTEKSRFAEDAATANRVGEERDANVEKAGSGFGTRTYGGGPGAGGKLRSSHRGNKRTPYERPVAGRHATAGGSSSAASFPHSKKLTIASRFRDSASRIIHSSASYLFSSLFKRSPPPIDANKASQGVSIPVEQETCEGMPDALAKQNGHSTLTSQIPALMDAVVKPVEAEPNVLDIGQVEEILKQKTWSRDQVNRLTQILQENVSDDINVFVEAEKAQEQPVMDKKDTSPIQVARAYMGEQATRPSGLAATVHTSTFLSSEVQSTPARTLLEDRYASSPFSRGWARGSASVRMPKRSLTIEDDLTSMGPVRRVKQKTSLLATASPYSYSRRMTGLSKPSETRMPSPPSQSQQTAMKILETLERMSPSPQGKLGATTEKSASGLQLLKMFPSPHKGEVLNDVAKAVTTSASKHTPETSRAREKSVVQSPTLVTSIKSAEPNVIGNSTLGEINSTEAEVKKSLVETTYCTPRSHTLSMLSKGFRMNAVFEETNSDEEAKSQVKPQTISVAKDQAAILKEECISTSGSSAGVFNRLDVSVPSSTSSPELASSSSSGSLFMVKSSSPTTPSHITAVSQDLTKNLFSFPFPAVAMETRPTLSVEAVSSTAAAAAAAISLSAVSTITAVKPATPSLFSTSAEASEQRVVSTSIVTSNASESTLNALPVLSSFGTGSFGNRPVNGSGVSSPVPTTPNTHIDPPQSENVVTMLTESPVADKQAEVDTMATDFMSEEADISVGASPTFSVPNLLNASPKPSTSSASLFGAGVSGTSSLVAPFLVGGTGSAAASASSLSSPFPFGAQSGTSFAPTVSGGSSSLPSASAFLFGGQSSKSSTEQTPMSAAGVSASSLSASPFAFGAQSGTVSTGQEPSSAAKPIFGQSSTKQTPPFGALPSSLANPFQSLSSSNMAVFGPTSSLPSGFTSSSSVVPSFGGASSTFQFGAPAISSSLMSGPTTSSTEANPFTTSLFSSSSAPTAPGTPTYSFGAVAASSSALGSASLATQPFAFGAAQANPFTAKSFSSSGTHNTFSSNFGATTMVSAPSPFSSTSSGSSTSLFGSNASSSVPNVFAFGSASTSNPSPFAFGSGQPSTAQAPTPAPFTFGNQSAAEVPNNGQPFGFNGGQPAAPTPVPNPFTPAANTQSGLGFALGATGGDKSGRKFIKAKRIGGAKKGK